MKTITASVALLLLLSNVGLSAPGVEAATNQPHSMGTDGLRRCIGADGGTLFTDRRCEDLQAAEYLRQDEPQHAGAALVRVRSCARNQDDLLFGVRAALENRDANRLADFYHWTGMDTAQGYRVLDRLNTFSKRPLLEVQLVPSAVPQETPPMELDLATDPDDIAVDPDAVVDTAEMPVRRVHAAHLLRVDQMRGTADINSEVTYFHLLSNAGCWWLQF